MLAYVSALLTGLKIAGFVKDPTMWFNRYAIASIGPALLIGAAYCVGTRTAPSRIDAIAQGCERPKRCGASYALQTSRVVPHGCEQRTARILNEYEGCCDAGTHVVCCFMCSQFC